MIEAAPPSAAPAGPAASAPRSELALRIADLVARTALASAPIERALVRLCRSPRWRRRLHLGAVPLAYPRVLDGPAIRQADLGRYRMCVNVREHLGLGPYFFGEPGTAWITDRLVREGDVCVDVGANVGHYTLFMASRIGPRGRVLAFEPNPPYTELLRQSVAANDFGGRVEVLPRALWSHAGEMTFFVSGDPQNSGVSSLVNHGRSVSAERTLRVETVTLDACAAERNIERFGLVKIDVERAEHEVLRGMRSLLAAGRIDYLIIEMMAGGEAERIASEHGYRCLLVDEARRRLVPMGEVPEGRFGDYLLVAPACAARLEAWR